MTPKQNNSTQLVRTRMRKRVRERERVCERKQQQHFENTKLVLNNIRHENKRKQQVFLG